MESSTLSFNAHERVSSAWDWFERAAPELTGIERTAYLLALGAAHGHDLAGQHGGAERSERDAALDRLRAFVAGVLQPRMKEARDSTRDADGLTDWQRRDQADDPPEAVEVDGVPMRAALPWERAMFERERPVLPAGVDGRR